MYFGEKSEIQRNIEIGSKDELEGLQLGQSVPSDLKEVNLQEGVKEYDSKESN